MKLNIKTDIFRAQPDPYIFEYENRFFLYVTGKKGVEMYYSNELLGEWEYGGIVCAVEEGENYWAPCVIKIKNKFYMYFSYCCPDECLCVAEADSPDGPFRFVRKMLNEFSIDPHVVKKNEGLYMFYAKDNLTDKRMGTRIFMEKMLDPYTLSGNAREVISPTMDEEIFIRNKYGDGRDWHTIEGPFYFEDNGYHYLMYSGACFGNDTYHVGYAVAEGDNMDNLVFKKYPDNENFCPLLFKNEFEEGTGHNSVIRYNGVYYVFYHGRDIGISGDPEYTRTARVCTMKAENGRLSVERIK